MADTLEKALGLKAELIKGGGGVFDIKVDGQLIYSKHKTGRFPDHQEILSHLEQLKNGQT